MGQQHLLCLLTLYCAQKSWSVTAPCCCMAPSVCPAGFDSAAAGRAGRVVLSRAEQPSRPQCSGGLHRLHAAFGVCPQTCCTRLAAAGGCDLLACTSMLLCYAMTSPKSRVCIDIHVDSRAHHNMTAQCCHHTAGMNTPVLVPSVLCADTLPPICMQTCFGRILTIGQADGVGLWGATVECKLSIHGLCLDLLPDSWQAAADLQQV